LRSLVHNLTPPVLRHGVRTLRSVLTPGRVPVRSGPQSPASISVPENPKTLSYFLGYPVLSVPLAKVRYSDGRWYAPSEHHFLLYYREGLPSLRRFYESHQPKEIFGYYFQQAPDRDGIPVVGTPWLRYEYTSRTGSGELGLRAEQGNQAHGPATERKLRLEAERLDRILASIRERGFRPDMGGYVKGYFMLRHDGDWVFTICSGFHRTAAMAHLGHRTIDVQFARSYPRCIEERDVAEWPMVVDRHLTPSEALAISSWFFRSEPLQLL